MKEQFTEKLRLSNANKDKLQVINGIIQDYQKQGYKLTLRQLYYQLVSKDIIPNNVKEYAKLSGLLVQGRMNGVVDWNAIEDRGRVAYLQYAVDDVAGAIEDSINQFKLNRMRDQDVYIEIWVEKDALSGILKRITNKYHVRFVANKGYSSATAMYKASKRFLYEESHGKECHVLYFGDHDPSGLDMVRDIRERLSQFGATVYVKQLGLTQEQINKYNPPPNPAKVTDPRAKSYIAEFGAVSWEVDALSPTVIHELVTENVEKLIDLQKFADILVAEDDGKEELRKFQEIADEEGVNNDED